LQRKTKDSAKVLSKYFDGSQTKGKDFLAENILFKLDSPASTPFTNSNEWNHSPAKPVMAWQSALIIINKKNHS
jgi:hypothetical protein